MTEQKKIENIIKKTLSLLSINLSQKVTFDNDSVNINVQTEETGILIGFHGETLLSLQTLLSLMVFKKLNKWYKITIDIGDYREKREEKLKTIAEQAVKEVLESQKSITLPYLPASERRIIHLYLKNNSQIKTESIGEGQERRLVIFPQT